MDAWMVVSSVLEILARLVPGFLAAFSGSQSDDEAIERARGLVPAATSPALDGQLQDAIDALEENS